MARTSFLIALLASVSAPAFAAPPQSPAALKVSALGTDAQVLAWSDSSADESGFALERLDGGTWQQVATVPADTTRHILRNQPTGSQSYRVIATNGDGPSAPSPQASTLRMNVLFFLADDMGYKDIVAHRNAITDGPTIYETPALDTLVSQGVTFTQAYCSGPKCVVARRALQTGMYDFRSAAIAKNGGIGTEMVTMGEAMKAGGYRTCFIGKWHLGGALDGSSGNEDNDSGGSFAPHTEPNLPYTNWSLLPTTDNKYIPATDPNSNEANKIPSAQGYDVAIATGEWGAPPIDPGTSTNPQSKGYYPTQIGTTSEYWYGLPDLYTTNPNEYLTDRLTTEATTFIGNHIVSGNSSQPFFLTLAHYAVHTPLQADPTRVTYFQNKRNSMNAQFTAHPGGDQIITDDSSKVRQHQDQPIYAAMMDSFDDSLATIRSYLAATNDPRNPGMTLAETTIIVLSSDHGGKSTHFVSSSSDPQGIPTSNYPLRQGKTWCYEGGLKIPLIVYWPGFSQAGTATDALVHAADFYTSILDMTGTPRVPTQHLDSISFAESTLIPGFKPRRDSHHWFSNADDGTGNPALAAYRFGNYKLVYHIIRRIWELYDLSEDPGERNDIASIRPDLVNEFYKQLSDRLVAVEGRRPVPGSNSWNKELLVVAPVTTIPAVVPNGAPGGLTGSIVSDTAVDLQWTDGSTDEERFVIQRKLSGSGAFVEIATVPANVTRFRDTGLTPGVTYQYRIQAENLKGWAGPSNTYNGTTASSAALAIIARGDDITTLVNETREFAPLLNDQGKNLAVTAITQPALGTATITNGGATIRFVPTTGATGTCTMSYTATGPDGSATGTVLITILADHTVAPALVYPTGPTKTDVDAWEFNEANNTTISNCANAISPTVKFSGATPRTNGSGSLRTVSSGGTNNIFRVPNGSGPGPVTLGATAAGIYELSMRFTAADLSGGDSDGANVSVALRDTTVVVSPTTTGSDFCAIRLQKVAGVLQLQFRNAGTALLHSFTSSTLSQPVAVRIEADMLARVAKVYIDLGAGEVFKGSHPFDPVAQIWNGYRFSASNNNSDFGPSDFIDVDYIRVKSVTYPEPPTAFRMWMDAAEGSTTPSADKLPFADADGDGVINISEYAFGGHPYDSASLISQYPVLGGTGGNGLVLTLPVIRGANFSPVNGQPFASINGISYQIQGSTHLNLFDTPVEEIHPSLEGGLPPSPRGWEYRSFRLVPGQFATRGFMRAVVSKVEP